MRLGVAAALAALFTPSVWAASPTQRPPLAKETLFSAGDVADVDPAGTLEEAALYKALQGLIERYGVDGVNYADKSVRKDLPITAAEARVLLDSAYDQLSQLVNVTVENRLAESSDDDAAQVIALYDTVVETSVNPSGSCRLLSGSKYAVAPKKGKVTPLTGSALVRWSEAISCLPGGGGMPINASSYGFRRAKLSANITRGEFLHKLNEAMDSSLAELELVGS